MQSLTEQHKTAIVIGVTIAVRGAMLITWHTHLADDRDGYAALARMVAEGYGYTNSETGRPTAFRPPAYPLFIAPSMWLNDGFLVIGALHLAVSVLTVWLTLRIARLVGLSSLAWIPALAVAFDPLLLQYCTFIMTETLSAFLVTWLMWLCLVAVRRPQSTSGSVIQGRLTVKHSALIGMVFGLNVLCRPVVWAFGLLSGMYLLIAVARKHSTTATSGMARPVIACVIAASLVIAPWLIRNAVVLGHPVLMTTHGGYTLLLGNNPVFAREVVNAQWGSVWRGPSLTRWQRSLDDEMRADGIDLKDEGKRNRWSRDKALQFCRAEPDTFLRACWLRIRRFWNVMPLQPSRESLPWIAVVGIGGWYTIVLAGFVLLLVRRQRLRAPDRAVLLLMVAAFALVHTIYWTNMRMRAPISPVIAVMSLAGWTSGNGARQHSRNGV